VDPDWDAATCEEPTCFDSDAPPEEGGGGGAAEEEEAINGGWVGFGGRGWGGRGAMGAGVCVCVCVCVCVSCGVVVVLMVEQLKQPIPVSPTAQWTTILSSKLPTRRILPPRSASARSRARRSCCRDRWVSEVSPGGGGGGGGLVARCVC